METMPRVHARVPLVARPMRALRLALCVLCACLASASLFAQEARVVARMSSGVVKLGSEARLVVEVRDAANPRLGELPKVDGLSIGPAGPASVVSSSEILGGRVKRSTQMTWSIPVRAAEPGRYAIQAFEVATDAGPLATRPVPFEVVKDVEGEDFGWLTIDAPREVHAGEPFTLDIVVGFDAALASTVNYANLDLPWHGAVAGMVELQGAEQSGRAVNQINLNGEQVIAVEDGGTRQRGGRTYQTLRWRKRYLASDAGQLELSTSHFEFGQIARSFFGLDPSQKKTMYKRLDGFAIRVLPIPEAGRPLDWSGAVGRLEARAAADRRAVDAGDSIKLTVDWSGPANLDFFEPPELARQAGFERFRVYGKTDRKTADRRTVVYDLAPIDPTLQEIPPVELSYYDTGSRQWATCATKPIPIQVRALKNAAALVVEEPLEVERERDVADILAEPRGGGEPWAPSSAAILAGMGLVLALGGRARRLLWREDDPWAPVARRRRRALREFERGLARDASPGGRHRALRAFLAASTNEHETAWAGRDVRAWARARRDAGAFAPTPELEGRAVDLLGACEAAEWSSRPSPEPEALLEFARRAAAEGWR
ncbi:MAG: hypothetical protein RL112_1137 [Planctomycetota bacterium]